MLRAQVSYIVRALVAYSLSDIIAHGKSNQLPRITVKCTKAKSPHSKSQLRECMHAFIIILTVKLH